MRVTYQKILILSFSLFSCSTSEGEQNAPSEEINLELVNENEWQMSQAVLEQINLYRTNLGKNSLIEDRSYATAYAVKHSKYMEASKNINHHNFFIRSSALKNKGASSVSENIAYGYSSAKTVVNAWLKSEAHKNIIEGDFSHVGFGIIKSLEGRYYYTTIYYKQ